MWGVDGLKQAEPVRCGAVEVFRTAGSLRAVAARPCDLRSDWGEAVEEAAVVRQAHQRPPQIDLFFASQLKAAKAHRFLDDPEDRLDGLPPPSVGRVPHRGPRLHFDPGKSLRANIDDLFWQVRELEVEGGGTTYVGTVLQHLVGAKLEVVVGADQIVHHGASVADASTDRSSDFLLGTTAIHVTTHSSEALIRKCSANLRAGLKPVIVTLEESVAVARYQLRAASMEDRVDVLDAGQFLTANIYERSLFDAAGCRETLSRLVVRYNEIVDRHETDPSLRIRVA